MKVTKSQIVLRGVQMYAYHGLMPQERRVGGTYTVDLIVDVAMTDALTTDIPTAEGTLPDVVADSISYAAVMQILRREMAVPSSLLEHVAHRVCAAILEQFPMAEAVEIELLKDNPPMGAQCSGAGVRLRVERDLSKRVETVE